VQTNLQLSSCAAQNANTHTENTAKHYDFQAKGKILKLAFELRKLGFSETYLKTLVNALNCLASNVDLENPDMVSMPIAQGKWKDSYKANLCDFYNHYCKHYNVRYVKARYRRDHKIPKVPSEEKIDQIIAHSSKKYAIIYSIIDCKWALHSSLLVLRKGYS